MCSSCTLRTVKLCQDKEGRDHTGKTYKEESWYLNHLLMLMCLNTLHTSFLLPEQVTLRDNRETQGEREDRSFLTSLPGGC